MYTSDKETDRRVLRHSLGNLLFAAFCALFGGIYEVFSFGVFSFCMIYAFAFPLAVGIILLIAYMRGKSFGRVFLNLLNAASATAALGSLASGVVEIYGTENRLLAVYPVASAVLFAVSAVVFVCGRIRIKSRSKEST